MLCRSFFVRPAAHVFHRKACPMKEGPYGQDDEKQAYGRIVIIRDRNLYGRLLTDGLKDMKNLLY